MNLRICNNGNSRALPASVEAVDLTFTSRAPLAEGTEITITDAERWLMAFVVGKPGDTGEFFVSGNVRGTWLRSSRVRRSEALRLFREFLGVA